MGDLLEELAALAHECWSNWMRYQERVDSPEARARWVRQRATPYRDLTEEEKRSDRDVVLQYQQPALAEIERLRAEATETRRRALEEAAAQDEAAANECDPRHDTTREAVFHASAEAHRALAAKGPQRPMTATEIANQKGPPSVSYRPMTPADFKNPLIDEAIRALGLQDGPSDPEGPDLIHEGDK